MYNLVQTCRRPNVAGPTSAAGPASAGPASSRRMTVQRMTVQRMTVQRMNGRASRRCKPNRLGATLVEFALVCNILLISVFMCMELARMNMARNLAQDAAYYAARVAIVPGATSAEAVAEAEQIMSSMFGNGYTVECSPINQDTTEVNVTVSVELNEVALFTPMFLGDIQLSSTATMQTERYNGFFQVQ